MDRYLLTLSVSMLSLLLGASGPGCDRPPPVSASVLAADSKNGLELRRISLPSGDVLRAFTLAARPGDLARGPGGEIYLAAGREVLLLPANEDPVPLLRVEERIDSVLPSADGTRLYILEHPPAAGGQAPGGGAGGDRAEEGRGGSLERAAPHRLRLWDLRGARLQGQVELAPLAYEIHEGPALVLATHLKGRRIEIARVGPEGFSAGGVEEIEVSDPAAEPQNRQALIRAAAVAPGGGFALLAENGVGGDIERCRLWTLDLPGKRFSFQDLAARGIFQDGIEFLAPGEGGAHRVLLNGRDRILLLTGGPGQGFREGKPLPLPGFFFDPRRVLPPGSPGGSPGELVLLAGTDVRRERGLLAAVDPSVPRLLRVWDLPAPADLLVVEGSR